jgi:hypothetical protein
MRLHPSEQHFWVPVQSLSIRQLPIRLSGGGHSEVPEGSISGHSPGLTSCPNATDAHKTHMTNSTPVERGILNWLVKSLRDASN